MSTQIANANRLLHAEIHVSNLEKSIEDYTKMFNLRLVRRMETAQDGAQRAVMAYGDEEDHFALLLTHRPGRAMQLGTGFGHFGLVFQDVYKAADIVKSVNRKITREAGPVKGGKTVIAFAQDEDGYKWEFIQRPETPEPLCQVMLRVGNLDKSIAFYESALGMKMLRTRDAPDQKYTLGFMGYGPEETHCVLELTYNYGVTSYERGDAYLGVAIAVDDLQSTAARVEKHGGKRVNDNSLAHRPDNGNVASSIMMSDPDGWSVLLVDRKAHEAELARADPLNAFCSTDPSALECKTFDD